MSAIFNATKSADVLAYIPRGLGFTPKESFVFLTLHGRSLGVSLRVDTLTNTPGDYVHMVLSFLVKDQAADGVLFIVYTDETGPDGTRPFLHHIHALEVSGA